MKISEADIFFKRADSFCKAMFSLRINFLNKHGSIIVDSEMIRFKTIYIEKEFNKNNSSSSALSSFIEKYHIELDSIIPITEGYIRNRKKLSSLYEQSLLINKSNDSTRKD